MRDDELVRRIADGDWAPADDVADHRVPSVAHVVELVRRRRRRRRLAAVGGAGVAGVGAVVALALLPGPSGTGSVSPAGPSGTPTTVSVDGACSNGSLVLSLGLGEGGGGLRQPVQIANIGSTACSVAVPSLTLVPEQGRPELVKAPTGREFLLQPGTSLSLMVNTTTMCANRTPALVETVRVETADGTTYDFHGAHLTSGCRPAAMVTDVSVQAATDTATTQGALSPADLPECTPADLRFGHGGLGAAAGSSGSDVNVANVGKQPCRLPGGIRLSLVTPDGEVPVVPASAMGSPHVLMPDEAASYGILNRSVCGEAQTLSPLADTVIVRFPGFEHTVHGARNPYGCGEPYVVEFRIEPLH